MRRHDRRPGRLLLAVVLLAPLAAAQDPPVRLVATDGTTTDGELLAREEGGYRVRAGGAERLVAPGALRALRSSSYRSGRVSEARARALRGLRLSLGWR